MEKQANRLRPWAGRYAQQMSRLTLSTYGTICHLCGRDGAKTADHIVPRAAGGSDALSNLRPAHLLCNALRRDMPIEQWYEEHPLPRTGTRATPSRQWV